MGFLITWTEENLSEQGHEVYRSTSAIDPQNPPAPIATLGPNVTRYEDGDITPGQTYHYRVTAFVGAVRQWSDEIVVEAVDPGIPTQDLIAFFTMDNVAGSVLVDENGQYPATLTNANQVAGRNGQALEFTAANARAEIDDDTILNNATEFSVAFWVYFYSTSGGDHDICSKGAHSSNEPFCLWRDESSTDSYAFLFMDSQGTYSDVLYSSTTPPLNQWQHVVLTFKGGVEARLYIDGQEDLSSPWSMTLISNIAPAGGVSYPNSFIIGNSGSYGTSSPKPLNGMIDQFRIFERALTAQEALDLYQEFN